MTNKGYINSKVPIRAKLHCAIESNISDGLDVVTTLNRFKKSKTNLRNSADAAILLVDNYLDGYSNCGYGNVKAIASGKTISMVRKDCALEDFSFAHELAHGFGLVHNRENSSS